MNRRYLFGSKHAVETLNATLGQYGDWPAFSPRERALLGGGRDVGSFLLVINTGGHCRTFRRRTTGRFMVIAGGLYGSNSSILSGTMIVIGVLGNNWAGGALGGVRSLRMSRRAMFDPKYYGPIIARLLVCRDRTPP